jgi:hypothetical protein
MITDSPEIEKARWFSMFIKKWAKLHEEDSAKFCKDVNHKIKSFPEWFTKYRAKGARTGEQPFTYY